MKDFNKLMVTLCTVAIVSLGSFSAHADCKTVVLYGTQGGAAPTDEQKKGAVNKDGKACGAPSEKQDLIVCECTEGGSKGKKHCELVGKKDTDTHRKMICDGFKEGLNIDAAADAVTNTMQFNGKTGF